MCSRSRCRNARAEFDASARAAAMQSWPPFLRVSRGDAGAARPLGPSTPRRAENAPSTVLEGPRPPMSGPELRWLFTDVRCGTPFEQLGLVTAPLVAVERDARSVRHLVKSRRAQDARGRALTPRARSGRAGFGHSPHALELTMFAALIFVERHGRVTSRPKDRRRSECSVWGRRR